MAHAQPAPAPPAPAPPPPDRRAVATTLLATHRAAFFALEVATLPLRDAVLGFAVATKVKNFAERRVTAFRKRVDMAFLALGITSETRRLELGEVVFEDGLPGAQVSAVLTNSHVDRKVLSEAKAMELLRQKAPSLAKRVLERPLRPAKPPARFSAEKFRELVTAKKITQAEYDACLVAALPSPTVTVEVPAEFEAAIAAMLLQTSPDVAA
jgi:hypothetical protein